MIVFEEKKLMQIIRLPVLSDNYIFLLHDPVRNIAAVVDPAEAQPVLEELTKLKAELVAIFNTHHHGDHVGGNTGLMKEFPDVKAIASNLAIALLIYSLYLDILALILPTISPQQVQESLENCFVVIHCLREVVVVYLKVHRGKW
jgi:glyoxylase-like metal-dependent hydrolase (beta-lactamase superfamily II)